MSPIGQAKPLLKIKDLTFRWPKGQREVIDLPELHIQKGERVFIKGQSGSGKTTLLSLIGGINTPQQGQIELLGKNLCQLSPAKRDQFRADHIGFIFQMFNLIPYLSVLENIELACQFSRLRSTKATSQGRTPREEALRLLSHLQLNHSSLINKPVNELSIGQQQRVATARALIGAPELIIADEPTSALDADTREHFLNLLMKECEQSDSTVLFVSHDRSLEPLFDRTIELNEVNRASHSLEREEAKP